MIACYRDHLQCFFKDMMRKAFTIEANTHIIYNAKLEFHLHADNISFCEFSGRVLKISRCTLFMHIRLHAV